MSLGGPVEGVKGSNLLLAHDLRFLLYCMRRIWSAKAAGLRHISPSLSLGIRKGVFKIRGFGGHNTVFGGDRCVNPLLHGFCLDQ